MSQKAVFLKNRIVHVNVRRASVSVLVYQNPLVNVSVHVLPTTHVIVLVTAELLKLGITIKHSILLIILNKDINSIICLFNNMNRQW